MQDTQHYDVIVVGGGVIGAAFALQLANNSDFKIAVLERSSAIEKDKIDANQRVLALGDLAMQLLDGLGVVDQLSADYCFAYQAMCVLDELSDGCLLFDAQQHQRQHLGHIVDAHCLNYQLQQALQQKNIAVHYNFIAQQMLSENNQICIASEQHRYTCNLLVGADGANSWVRQQAKLFNQRADYQQQAIVAKINSSKAHQDTAWQVFLEQGPVGVLPLANGQSSIVWSANQARAQQLLAMPTSDFESQLTLALKGHLGDISLASKRLSFGLFSARVEEYFKPNIVLIGDAAHTIHPLAGQGANLGFKDVLALSETIKDLPVEQLGKLSSLSRYQRARKSDNQQTDHLMTLLNKSYQVKSPWWQKLRAVAMNSISRSPLLKSFLIDQAMGRMGH